MLEKTEKKQDSLEVLMGDLQSALTAKSSVPSQARATEKQIKKGDIPAVYKKFKVINLADIAHGKVDKKNLFAGEMKYQYPINVILSPEVAQKSLRVDVTGNVVYLAKQASSSIECTQTTRKIADQLDWSPLIENLGRDNRIFNRFSCVHWASDLPSANFKDVWVAAIERLTQMGKDKSIAKQILNSKIKILSRTYEVQQSVDAIRQAKGETTESSGGALATFDTLIKVLKDKTDYAAMLHQFASYRIPGNPENESAFSDVAGKTGSSGIEPMDMSQLQDDVMANSRFQVISHELMNGAYDLIAYKLLNDATPMKVGEVVRLIKKFCPKETGIAQKIDFALKSYISMEKMVQYEHKDESKRREIYKKASMLLVETSLLMSVQKGKDKFSESLPYSGLSNERLPELMALPYLARANYEYLLALPNAIKEAGELSVSISTFAKDVIVFFVLLKKRTDAYYAKLAEYPSLVEKCYEAQVAQNVFEISKPLLSNVGTELDAVYHDLLNLFAFYRKYPALLNTSKGTRNHSDEATPSLREIQEKIHQAGQRGYIFDKTAITQAAFGNN